MKSYFISLKFKLNGTVLNVKITMAKCKESFFKKKVETASQAVTQSYIKRNV